MLRIADLHKTLKRQEILKGVDLEVGDGQNIVIIGRSGTGKSVLLRNIIGLLRPEKGSVFFQGTDLCTLGEEELNPFRREIGMLFQNGALFDSFTVEKNLAFPLLEQGITDLRQIRERVEEALEWVELPGQGKKHPAELSGGMRKRVALARAAISRPKLMLYDEPTTGLDPVVSDSISKLILRLGRRLKMSSIVITHDMASAYLVADRIDFLREGRIYFSGTVDEVQNSRDETVYNFVRGISEISLEEKQANGA
jgi:phospholipid/cholesterol/gamma-HCH transport system ATP-binding protein